jgi:hypothetical protein
MKRGIIATVLMLLFTSGALASEGKPREPWFDLHKIVRVLVQVCDEILTGTKP